MTNSFESPRSEDQVPTHELALNPHGLLRFGANWLRSGKRGYPAATFMGWGEPSEGHDCSFSAGRHAARNLGSFGAGRELGSLGAATNLSPNPFDLPNTRFIPPNSYNRGFAWHRARVGSFGAGREIGFVRRRALSPV